MAPPPSMSPLLPNDRGALGRHGEDLAAAHLLDCGMRILARNWRPRGMALRGELDIVALDGSTVVACEVKTRRVCTHGTPAESVTPGKVTRLRRLLTCWRIAHDVHGPLRVDVVGIVLPADGPAQIAHLRGIG